jgi:hypothetical protein
MAAAIILCGQSHDAGVVLQRAIRKEMVEGDLKGAIELYRKVVAAAAKDRGAAAKALLRLGECYEKQGNVEARKAYERLVNEFADQKEQARDAGARLVALGLPAAGTRAMSVQFIHSQKGNGGLGGRVLPDGSGMSFIDQSNGDVSVRDLRTGTIRRLTHEGTMSQPGAQSDAVRGFKSHSVARQQADRLPMAFVDGSLRITHRQRGW